MNSTTTRSTIQQQQPSNYKLFELTDKIKNSKTSKEALKYYQEIKQLGLIPDIYTYNILINILGINRNFLECDEIYKELKNSDVKPNVITYSCLIKSFADNFPEKTKQYIREMNSYNIKKDHIINPILKKYNIN